LGTDIGRIVANLTAFYDFRDKTVVSVGAGGGQLIEYARSARRVIAVERDSEGARRLAERAQAASLDDRLEILEDDFHAVRPRGDLTLFEFCLHEFGDPARALDHGAETAPDVVVLDHAAGSPWMWSAGEERGVEAAWAAVARREVRRRQELEGIQIFARFSDLESRLSACGPVSRARIERFRDAAEIVIPMPYRIVLL
jgi:predicted RNA methylase